MKRSPVTFAEREAPRPASTAKLFMVGTLLLALMTLFELFR